MRKLFVIVLSVFLTIISVDHEKKGKSSAEPAKKGMKRSPVK